MKPSRLLPSRYRGSAVALAVVTILVLLAIGVGLLSLGIRRGGYTQRRMHGVFGRDVPRIPVWPRPLLT